MHKTISVIYCQELQGPTHMIMTSEDTSLV